MSNNKEMYGQIFEGKLEEAEAKFPFIQHGVHLKVFKSFGKNIAIFPNRDTFYVLTLKAYTLSKTFVTLEETNSIQVLDVIVNRETKEEQYLSEEDFTKITTFLSENDCFFTLAG